MLGKQIRDLTFLLGISVAFISLFFSAFLTSLGTFFLFIAIVFSLKDVQKLATVWWYVYLTPLVLTLIDLLRTENYEVVMSKALLMFGFVVIASSIMLNGKLIKKNKVILFGLWIFMMLLINTVSVSNYFIHRQELDLLLLQSKAIPIFGGMHHIHFGILNAISILIISYLLLFSKHKRYRGVFATLLIVFLICFHILSSRTGLVSLYASIGVSLVIYAFVKKDYKSSIAVILVVLAVNALAFSFSSSFKNKFANSVEDIESWDQSESINYKSMGMRIESYKNSLEIIKKNMWFGVGTGDMEHVIQVSYEDRNTVLYKENRIGPHNQFLEFGIKYGLLGIIYMLVFFFYWFKRALKPLDMLLLSSVLLLLFSSQFESLLERQVSIFFTAALYPILINAFSVEN